MTKRLSKKKLEAIHEALIARLAGELDGSDGDLPREDYVQAVQWVEQKLGIGDEEEIAPEIIEEWTGVIASDQP